VGPTLKRVHTATVILVTLEPGGGQI